MENMNNNIDTEKVFSKFEERIVRSKRKMVALCSAGSVGLAMVITVAAVLMSGGGIKGNRNVVDVANPFKVVVYGGDGTSEVLLENGISPQSISAIERIGGLHGGGVADEKVSGDHIFEFKIEGSTIDRLSFELTGGEGINAQLGVVEKIEDGEDALYKFSRDRINWYVRKPVGSYIETTLEEFTLGEIVVFWEADPGTIYYPRNTTRAENLAFIKEDLDSINIDMTIYFMDGTSAGISLGMRLIEEGNHAVNMFELYKK